MKVNISIDDNDILYLKTTNSLTKKSNGIWFLLFYTNDIPTGFDRVKDCIYLDDFTILNLQTNGKAITTTENYEVELIKENYISISLDTAKT